MEGVSHELHREVEALLYHEASLLEDGEFDAWLALLTEDVRYVMPVRRNVQPDRPGEAPAAAVEPFSLFNDDKPSLTMRIKRIATGRAHSEVPLSVTQRLITNIRVEAGDDPDECVARSSFLVHQMRRGRYGATFLGKRRDRLRREDGAWKIADRRIELAQTILPTTISILF
jgi:3-phenylpropionate/cinnamic acid dioxygenase small subunit